ncbi:CGG triplet repeat-binding protein 1-like [Montipora capricornis]|uniref:CGG triplet repeat-binding protein 1-like n=1 Tax=Montipora capricornis TaxID=246305 RepID=UPI0035F12DE9
MDKFLVKPKKKPCSITPQERAKQHPGKFRADDNLLFCSTCNVVVDHHRKSVLDNHLSAVSHIKRMNKSSSKRAKQQTLKTSFKCKTPAHEEKVKVCHEWIRACAAANIPLNKSENPVMREFVLSRVVNGGAIPKGTQLRDHLLDVYELEKEELKQKIKEANVAIMVDELCDDNGRCVIDVMATILDFDELSPSNGNIAYLLDTHFVTETNNKTVSQAVVKTINDYGIDFDRVLIFNTDNATYMKKAFRETLSCLFSSCVHITCHSHIISLVAGDFKRHFSFVTEFAK